MANQNNYLRRQLGVSLRQKRRELRALPLRDHPVLPGKEKTKGKEKKNPKPVVPQVKETLQGTLGEGEDVQPTSMTLKLTS